MCVKFSKSTFLRMCLRNFIVLIVNMCLFSFLFLKFIYCSHVQNNNSAPWKHLLSCEKIVHYPLPYRGSAIIYIRKDLNLSRFYRYFHGINQMRFFSLDLALLLGHLMWHPQSWIIVISPVFQRKGERSTRTIIFSFSVAICRTDWRWMLPRSL